MVDAAAAIDSGPLAGKNVAAVSAVEDDDAAEEAVPVSDGDTNVAYAAVPASFVGDYYIPVLVTGYKIPFYVAAPSADSGTAVSSAIGGDAVHLRPVSVVRGGSSAVEDVAVPGAGRRKVLAAGKLAVPVFGGEPFLAAVPDTAAFVCVVLVDLTSFLMPATGAAGDQIASLE